MKMILSFLLIYLLSSLTFAKVDKPFFYKVEKNGNIAYLLGSIHTGVDYDELPVFVKNKVEASKTIILETDLGQEAQIQIQQNFPTPYTKPLNEILDQDSFFKLVEAVKPFGLMEDQVKALSPFHAISLYTVSSLPAVQKPIDSFLYQLANSNDKNFSYLEPVSAQVKLLKKLMTEEAMVELLQKPKSELLKETSDLLQAYLSGNPDELFNLMEFQTNSDGSLDFVLFERNESWVKPINMALPKDGIEFITVGAGHLGGGQRGLLELLKNDGFSITKITE